MTDTNVFTFNSRQFTFTPLQRGSPYFPAVLGFLHLAQRGVFEPSAIQAWENKVFSINPQMKDQQLLLAIDTSTQTLTVSILRIRHFFMKPSTYNYKPCVEVTRPGFSKVTGARRKSPATSSVSARYFWKSKLKK